MKICGMAKGIDYNIKTHYYLNTHTHLYIYIYLYIHTYISFKMSHTILSLGSIHFGAGELISEQRRSLSSKYL